MATAAVVEYGIDEERFEEAVSENFKCGICFNVLNDPKSCQNNQHYFCFGCIGQHLKNSRTCPNCAEELAPETLGTPPRVLLNCISELRVKCDYIKRGCCDRVQLGNLPTHLGQCGFAPVTCGNDGCEMQINSRDKIHHETELCDFRRVQCHDCRELREEIVKIGTKQDQLHKSQAKLEGKLNEMTTRLANVEKNVITQVNELFHGTRHENAAVVEEINNIKCFMNDVLRNLSSINTAMCKLQAATKQDNQRSERENLQHSTSKASESLKMIERDPVFRQQYTGKNATASNEVGPNKSEILSNSSAAGDLIDLSKSEPLINCAPSFDSSDSKNAPSYPTLGVPIGTWDRVDRTPTSPDATSPRSKRISGLGNCSPFSPDTQQQLEIGMKVMISRQRGKLSRGVIKYIGFLPGRDQVHIGLELQDGDGKHDGKFNGHRFFKCQPNHGIFTTFERVVMAYSSHE